MLFRGGSCCFFPRSFACLNNILLTPIQSKAAIIHVVVAVHLVDCCVSNMLFRGGLFSFLFSPGCLLF